MHRLATLNDLTITQLVTIGAPWRSMHDEQSREQYSQLTRDSWKQHCLSDYEAYQKLNPELHFELFFKSLKNMALDIGAKSHPNERVKHIHCPLGEIMLCISMIFN
jgi:hypothetical protein